MRACTPDQREGSARGGPHDLLTIVIVVSRRCVRACLPPSSALNRKSNQSFFEGPAPCMQIQTVTSLRSPLLVTACHFLLSSCDEEAGRQTHQERERERRVKSRQLRLERATTTMYLTSWPDSHVTSLHPKCTLTRRPCFPNLGLNSRETKATSLSRVAFV